MHAPAHPVNTLDIVISSIRAAVAKGGGDPDAIDGNTNLLSEIDLDSLAMLDVVTTLERLLSIELISNLDIGVVNTPSKLADLADSLGARKSSK